NTSPASGAIAPSTRSAQSGARKCWPKRRRGRPPLLRTGRRVIDVAVPIALFDFFDLFFGQSEVVADLVNQGLPDRDDQVVLVGARFFDRSVEERDLVGETIAVGPLSFGERRAFVQA